MTLPSALDHLLATHRPPPTAPIVDEVWDLLAATARGGKHLRGTTLIRAHHALGGAAPEAAMTLAAATEILHAGLLVQDDVLDHDLVRRGQPNLAALAARSASAAGSGTPSASAWADAAGVLAGDLALGVAYTETALLPVPGAQRSAVVQLLARTLRETITGELGDLALQYRLVDDSPATRTAVARAKTARYTFAWPLLAGAILANAPTPVLDALEDAADDLGLAYQLADDLGGTFAAGVPSDLRERKQTLLMAEGIRLDPRGSPASLGGSGRAAELDAAEAREIQGWLHRSGAVDATARRARAALTTVRRRAADTAGAAVVVRQLADRLEAMLDGTLDTVAARAAEVDEAATVDAPPAEAATVGGPPH